jgi:hypothetical protein
VTEIAIWQPGEVALPGQVTGQVPNTQLDDWIMVADKVVRLAEVICRSPFVPDGLRGSVPATAAAILTGRELGIPPMTSLANIHVIHGKPGLSALVMRALVLSQGHEWQDVDVSNTRVVVKGRRKGAAEWTEASFSVADAQTAKLALGGYPQDKLYARASARLARRAFADVIAGMPYSIEELEDGVTEDEPTAAASTPPAEDKPRTAQRRQRTQTASPATPRPPAAPAPSAPTAGAGEALPPLPGDFPPLPGEEDAPGPETAPPAGTEPAAGPGAPDETDYDTPGTVPPTMITAIWTVLSTNYAFKKDEKDQARAVCAHIINGELASTKDLSRNQAKTILDTLGHWQYQAEQAGQEPRDYMTSLMAAQDEDPRDE